MTAEPILRVRGLHMSFGAVVAARDINVDIAAGEIVGIIGANGAGKTTFVNLVTGWLTPTAGTIVFDGADITGMPPRQGVWSGIARSFQVSQVFPTMSVFDNIVTALGIARSPGIRMLSPINRANLHDEAHRLLDRYGIGEYAGQDAATLAQGIRKLLDIAMAVACEPRLLLLDEPTSGVSIDEKFGIMDTVMQALAEDNVTVLFIEHDMEIVARYVSRVLAFYQGEIICDAPTAEALADARVREFVIGSEPVRGERRDA